MLKIKKKYLGVILKDRGISIELSENLSQNEIEFVKNRFGADYTQKVTTKKKEDVEDTERPSE